MLEPDEKVILILRIKEGSRPNLFGELDPNDYDYVIQRLNEAYRQIREILDGNNLTPERIMVRSVFALHQLDIVAAFLKHPIHLNTFKDKYGNTYIQARTTKEIGGKLKWFNGYVGSLVDYPKGVDDKNAIAKGHAIVRRKMAEHFGFKMENQEKT
jgi:hypothetical protein